MPFELLITYLKLPVFAMVLSRLGAMLMFQPAWSSFAVPMNLRVVFVLATAALVTPFAAFDPAAAPATFSGLALAVGGELLRGFMMGLVLSACWSALEMSGMLIAQESGLAYGQILDPTSGEERSVMASFYSELGLVVYLIIGGHRAIFAACLKTFERVPLMRDLTLDPDAALTMLTLGAEAAVRIAAPAVLAMFLVNMALGLISRTMPQLNITSVGFTMKSLLALMVMAGSLPTAMNIFVGVVESAVGMIEAM